MKNDRTGENLAPWQVVRLHQLRALRRAARRNARSNDPRKREVGRQVLATIPDVIEQTLRGIR